MEDLGSMDHGHGPHDANALLSFDISYATYGTTEFLDDLEPLKPQSRERSNGTAEAAALANTLAATAAGRIQCFA